MAVLLSLLITGGGQFYNGDYLKGTAFLGGAVGGTVLALTNIPSTELVCADLACFRLIFEDTGNSGVFWGGLGVALGLHVYSMVEAGIRASEINRKSRTITRYFKNIQMLPIGTERGGGFEIAYRRSF